MEPSGLSNPSGDTSRLGSKLTLLCSSPKFNSSDALSCVTASSALVHSSAPVPLSVASVHGSSA